MTRIALVQQRVSADKTANVERGVRALETAAANGAELVCFPELAFEPFYSQCRAEPGYEQVAWTAIRCARCSAASRPHRFMTNCRSNSP
jgi:predicted amidohydrolase